MEELMIVETNDVQKLKKKRWRFRLNKRTVPIFAIVLSIVMIIAIIVIFKDTVSTGAEALADGYNNAYTEEKDATYQKQYDIYKNSAEEKFHVSNRVSIYIGELKEVEKLEVLKVSDVEFVIEDNNDENIVSWLEVPGEGMFVVDLKNGEFVVDNERAHVLVKVPYPELTNITIDYANVNNLLFEDGVFNGSNRIGEELAKKQLGEAELLLEKEFTSNENFYLNAQKVAVNIIEALIKQLNPEVENLTVDVEFY